MATLDYTRNNIVNLMSSILSGCGGRSIYPALSSIPPSTLRKYKNIVLMVIDGLGYDQVRSLPSHSFLKQHLAGKMSSVFPKIFLQSHYNTLLGKKAEKYTYRAIKLAEWVNATARAVTSSSSQPHYIYSYWSKYDDLCHYYGKESDKARNHLQEIDTAIQRLATKIKDTDTLLLVTADHGHTSITRKNTIVFDKYPTFQSYLAAPACGEARAVMLYIKAEKKKEFEQFVGKHWKKQCVLISSSDLIKKQYCGLFAVHPSLQERVGDYVLLAKEGYAFREHAISKKHPFQIGNHGGLSKEELEVPLVMVKI